MEIKKAVTLIVAAFAYLPVSAKAEALTSLLKRKGIVDSVPDPAPEGQSRIYYQNGLKIDSEDSSLNLNGLLQPRYSNTFGQNENKSSFELSRVRLQASGNALGKEIAYNIQSDFIEYQQPNGASGPDLYDAFLQWNANQSTSIKFGLFESGLSRQFVTSIFRNQFFDRSAVTNFFTTGRQKGAGIYHTIGKKQVELYAGVFNGESKYEGTNFAGDDTRESGVATARWNLLGTMNPYEEGDNTISTEAAISTGIAYNYSDYSPDLVTATNAQSLDYDLNFKYLGFSFHTELINRQEEGATPRGVYAQAGYMVTKNIEFAGRYGRLVCDGSSRRACKGYDGNTQQTAAATYYFSGHNLKAQLAYDQIANESNQGLEDDVVKKVVLQTTMFF